MSKVVTAENLLKHSELLFKKCHDVMKKKNADYSASDVNAFRNFEAVEYFKVTDAKTGMMVRMTDKFARICNLLHKKEGGEVKDEALQDTIEDFINYLAILHCRLENEKDIK